MAATTNKQRGNRHELAVALRLTELGATVAWPYGDGAPWDLICEFGGNKINRLQVKGTDKVQACDGYRVNLAHGRIPAKLYTREQCDFIIGVTPIGTYVMPVDKVDRDRLIVWQGGRRNNVMPYYDKFKEAWHLLQ